MKIDPTYEANLQNIYIHNEDELRRIGAAVNGLHMNSGRTFHLANDITIDGSWTPIGDDLNRFQANFDGYGHTIRINGFDPAVQNEWHLGLFGCVDGANITNLGIAVNFGSLGSPVTTSTTLPQCIGGLAGGLENSTVENVTVRGSICFDQTGGSDGLYIGGIAGSINNSTIKSCRVIDAVIYGKSNVSSSTGGIASCADGAGTSTIENCYSRVPVTAFSGSLNVSCAGGIIGDLGNSTITVSKCYTAELGSAKVIATGSSGDNYAGGIAGRAGTGSTIRYCVAVVDVAGGPTTAGRLSGSDSINILDNYVTTGTTLTGSGGVSSADGTKILGDYPITDFRGSVHEGRYTGLTWNFSTIWTWSSGSDYPVLRHAP
jgi:hypothetical protein